MVITVTMNPAIDKTIYDNKIIESPGGKGINVSKALSAYGCESIATGFLGQETGEWIKKQLDLLGIKNDFVKIVGRTRVNTKIVTTDGTIEKNEPGPNITTQECECLFQKIRQYCSGDTCVIIAGSVPACLGTDTCARLIKLCKSAHAEVFLDTSGEQLKEGVLAIPDIIKPNEGELQELLGVERNIGDCTGQELARLVEPLLDLGISSVIISRGQRGAIFVKKDLKVEFQVPKVSVKSTVGAGDTLVAGFCYKRLKGESDLSSALFAIAASVGAVTTEGTEPETYENTLYYLAKVTYIML